MSRMDEMSEDAELEIDADDLSNVFNAGYLIPTDAGYCFLRPIENPLRRRNSSV